MQTAVDEKEIGDCPICGFPQPELFLERLEVPVHQNLMYPSAAAAAGARTGDLRLACCPRCAFVFNAAFDLSRLDYSERYENRQTFSAVFADHVDSLARQLVDRDGVRNAFIVEVGCGRGVFLRKLVEADPGNRGHGYDPAYVGPDDDLDGRLRFTRTFFGGDVAHENAPATIDVVVCRHVIEHVPKPLELLRAIRSAIPAGSRPRIYFETPCVEWILANEVFWDLFYEHCSYFTTESLRSAFEFSGYAVTEVRHVFFDQYLWLEATLDPTRVVAGPGGLSIVPEAGAALLDKARRFSASERRIREGFGDQMRQGNDSGRIALWGAGAKGVTFANLIDPERRWVDCLVDVNPGKQGKFIERTGHPIVAPAELSGRQVDTIFYLNPNYGAEIAEMVRGLGLKARLVDLMGKS